MRKTTFHNAIFVALLFLVGLSNCQRATAADASSAIEALKQASDNPLAKALGDLKDTVERDLPDSLVSKKTLDQIQADTASINGMVPPSLPPIYTPESMSGASASNQAPGTLAGANTELQNLKNIASNRQTDIAILTNNKNDIADLYDQYTSLSDQAAARGNELEKLASDPATEFYSRLGGKSVSLSWGEFITEIVPALQDRQNAAEDAMKRYDSAITSAQNDLDKFNEAMRMFGDGSPFTEEEGAPILPGDATDLQKLQYALDTVKWANTAHPITGFKPAPQDGKLAAFEAQLVDSLVQINSIPDRQWAVSDKAQVEADGNKFFDLLVNKKDYQTASKMLSDAAGQSAPFQVNAVAAAKEALRASVAQQLSNYLDRNNPWQTLQQVVDSSEANSDEHQALQRAEQQRASAIVIQHKVWSQAVYQQQISALQHAIEDYNKKKSDYMNLQNGAQGGGALPPPPVAPSACQTAADQVFCGFMNPTW